MDAVVVTYNSERKLAAFAECERVQNAFESVIVVDNDSTDRTRAVAEAAGMVVIRQPRNEGFGAAANVGVRRTRGHHFALLNPDIRFETGEGPTLLAHHFADRDVAIVGPRLILPSGAVQDSARMVPTPANLVKRRVTRGDHGVLGGDAVLEVPWVVGGCMVIRRAAFDEIGGFDPRYFLYFEDVDLCARLWESGWTVRMDPRVSVRHDHEAASRGRLWSAATRHHIRSATRFFITHPRFIVGRTRRRRGRPAPQEP